MVEIMGGDGIGKAFQALGIPAICRYMRKPYSGNSYAGELYEVWEVSDADYDKLCDVPDEAWQSDWGWWRCATGSILGAADSEFIINGQKIKAWDGAFRQAFFNDYCSGCTDFKNKDCRGCHEDDDPCIRKREYKNLFDYSCQELGASTERNFCAICIDLAAQNGMKMWELFEKYLGDNAITQKMGNHFSADCPVPISIKYFSQDLKKLEPIAGKSDWIDLRAAEDVVMKAGEFRLIPLGVAMKLPVGYEAHVVPRSSTFKNYGIIQTNSMAVIDNSYCGDNDQWRLPVYATRDTEIHFNDRICQFRIMQNQPKIQFYETESLDGANRGGFGSTGVE